MWREKRDTSTEMNREPIPSKKPNNSHSFCSCLLIFIFIFIPLHFYCLALRFILLCCCCCFTPICQQCDEVCSFVRLSFLACVSFYEQNRVFVWRCVRILVNANVFTFIYFNTHTHTETRKHTFTLFIYSVLFFD